MLSFKQFLLESRYAPLYHAIYGNTENIIIETANSILTQGFLPKTLHERHFFLDKKSRIGVSFTRDIRFAKRWGGQSIIFEIDQEVLRKKFKLIPIDFWKGKNRPVYEAEEFVETSTAIPPYIIKNIWIDKHLEERVHVSDNQDIKVLYNKIKNDFGHKIGMY